MKQAEKYNRQGVEGVGRFNKQYPLRIDQSTDAIVIIIVMLVENIRHNTWASDAKVGCTCK